MPLAAPTSLNPFCFANVLLVVTYSINISSIPINIVNFPAALRKNTAKKVFSCDNLTGECQWLHLELIKEMQTFCKTLFPVVDYAYSTIPTYPSGQIGFMLCSKNPVSVLTFSVCPLPQYLY